MGDRDYYESQMAQVSSVSSRCSVNYIPCAGQGRAGASSEQGCNFFQMHSCLQQKTLAQVRELSQEINDYRGGAMRKQQEKEVREVCIPTNIAFVSSIRATAVQLNKTLSYVKKHMFNLFKSTGQERVREYMKEVILVVL